MADISLSDHYVVLLQDVVNQSKFLREEIHKDKSTEKDVLENIAKKVDGLATTVSSMNATAARRVRQIGGPTKVPKMCSNDFRQQIKKMAKADPENLSLNLEESQDSDHNLVIFNQVKDELYHSYGGEGKCPWTVLQMKVALKTYMRSLRASAKRKAKGNNQEHVRSCRRQNRKKEKLGRRLKSLDSKKWSNGEVEEEEPFKTVAYIVKPLNWESQELKKAKKSLDKHHKDSLPDLVKRRVIPRRNGHPSRRQKPNDCPDWACLQ